MSERRVHPRAELAYILDFFPIICRKDEERWGEYQTKHLSWTVKYRADGVGDV